MLNFAILTGRLIADPTFTQTEDSRYCCFSITVDRPTQNDKTTESDFFDCIAWEAMGEIIAKWYKKGDMITVVGNLYEPKCILDTAGRTVTQVDPKTFEKKSTEFHTDYVKDHLRYVANKHPERLQRLVNEGWIVKYLDTLEIRAIEAVDRQVEKWKASDKEYQTAILLGDTPKAVGLVNCLQNMAREIVYDTVINV